jgi:hypothetical protein
MTIKEVFTGWRGKFGRHVGCDLEGSSPLYYVDRWQEINCTFGDMKLNGESLESIFLCSLFDWLHALDSAHYDDFLDFITSLKFYCFIEL